MLLLRAMAIKLKFKDTHHRPRGYFALFNKILTTYLETKIIKHHHV